MADYTPFLNELRKLRPTAGGSSNVRTGPVLPGEAVDAHGRSISYHRRADEQGRADAMDIHWDNQTWDDVRAIAEELRDFAANNGWEIIATPHGTGPHLHIEPAPQRRMAAAAAPPPTDDPDFAYLLSLSAGGTAPPAPSPANAPAAAPPAAPGAPLTVKVGGQAPVIDDPDFAYLISLDPKQGPTGIQQTGPAKPDASTPASAATQPPPTWNWNVDPAAAQRPIPLQTPQVQARPTMETQGEASSTAVPTQQVMGGEGFLDPLRSTVAGAGQAASSIGDFLEYLEVSSPDDAWRQHAAMLQSVAPENPTLGDKFLMSLPSSLALMVMPLGASAAAGRLALGAVGSTAVGAVGVGASRAVESAMEAGGVYRQMIAAGKPLEEARRAALQAYRENLALYGLDAGEYAIAFGSAMFPALRGIAGKLPRLSGIDRRLLSAAKFIASAGMEGAEEVAQTYIAERATGMPASEEEYRESFILGAATGSAFQTIASVSNHISNNRSADDINNAVAAPPPTEQTETAQPTAAAPPLVAPTAADETNGVAAQPAATAQPTEIIAPPAGEVQREAEQPRISEQGMGETAPDANVLRETYRQADTQLLRDILDLPELSIEERAIVQAELEGRGERVAQLPPAATVPERGAMGEQYGRGQVPTTPATEVVQPTPAEPVREAPVGSIADLGRALQTALARGEQRAAEQAEARDELTTAARDVARQAERREAAAQEARSNILQSIPMKKLREFEGEQSEAGDAIRAEITRREAEGREWAASSPAQVRAYFESEIGKQRLMEALEGALQIESYREIIRNPAFFSQNDYMQDQMGRQIEREGPSEDLILPYRESKFLKSNVNDVARWAGAHKVGTFDDVVRVIANAMRGKYPSRNAKNQWDLLRDARSAIQGDKDGEFSMDRYGDFLQTIPRSSLKEGDFVSKPKRDNPDELDIYRVEKTGPDATVLKDGVRETITGDTVEVVGVNPVRRTAEQMLKDADQRLRDRDIRLKDRREVRAQRRMQNRMRLGLPGKPDAAPGKKPRGGEGGFARIDAMPMVAAARAAGRAVNALRAGTGRAVDHVITMGRAAYAMGKQTFAQWRNQLRQWAGDVWDNVQPHLRTAWEDAKLFAMDEYGAATPEGGGGRQRMESDRQAEARARRSALFEQATVNRTRERLRQQTPAANHELGNEVVIEFVRGVSESDINRRYETNGAFTDFMSNLIVPISTRLAYISKGLRRQLRNFEFTNAARQMRDIELVGPWLKKYESLPENTRAALDAALMNGNRDVANEIMDANGMSGDFAVVDRILTRLRNEMIDRGYEVGFIPDYYPRHIRDSRGLNKDITGYEERGAITETIRQRERKLNRELTEEERAEIANGVIRGYSNALALSGPQNIKRRALDVVPEAWRKHYSPSSVALVSYITRANEAVASRDFFGKGPDINESIGRYVADLVDTRQIPPEAENQTIALLRARFGHKPMSGGVAAIRDINYMATMGNIISTVTQIGDFYTAIYMNGLPNATKNVWLSMFGRSPITTRDIGIDKIAEEFTSNQSMLSRALGRVFRATGLQSLDRIGKQTLINSTIDRFRREVRAGQLTPKMQERMRDVFGDEYSQVVADLREGRTTDNVKLLAFNTLLDFQPVALSEMPVGYLRAPNGRIFYQLKTYAVKQLDVLRREGIDRIVNGRTNTEKMQGLTNLMYISFLMMACNMGADKIKDFILGRDTDLDDLIVDNMIRVLGFSKYSIYRARSSKSPVRDVLLSVIAPPTSVLEYPVRDVIDFVQKGSDYPIKDAQTWNLIPYFGKLYNWWFGRGRTQIENRRDEGVSPARRGGELRAPELKTPNRKG